MKCHTFFKIDDKLFHRLYHVIAEHRNVVLSTVVSLFNQFGYLLITTHTSLSEIISMVLPCPTFKNPLFEL
jgi:hypothetical protein